MQQPFIANIVVTSNLGIKLNLDKLKETLTEIKYNPKKFGGAILKINDPIRSTFLLWNSGKVVCLGTKNLEDCEKAIKILIDKLNNIGFVCVEYSGFDIQNIVTSFNSGFLIDLGEFSLKYRKESFYNPEIFCGLHFKIHPRIIVLIFYTGKIVITGCKDMGE